MVPSRHVRTGSAAGVKGPLGGSLLICGTVRRIGVLGLGSFLVMCGIVGYVGQKDALPILLGGLEALEYRGYDSAGLALCQGPRVEITRATGKLAELKKLFPQQERPRDLWAHQGIGHTRWATHGRPTETNAHPHSAGRVSLIHNGIIENYLELRESLEKEGCVFRSETDTEVAAHLMNSLLKKGLAPLEAMRQMCASVRGSYAFLVIDEKTPGHIFVAKNSTPIILGKGLGENFIASDIPALLSHTRQIVVLEDGDLADVTAGSIYIENGGKEVARNEERVAWDPITAKKGGFPHFMLKEIFDQTQAVADTLRGRYSVETGSVILPELTALEAIAPRLRRVVLVACGTAWHACLEGKFFIESFAKIPCEVDYASEFRYRTQLFDSDTLVIAVSQSGETLDTLGAIELAKGKSPTLTVCNVVGASICRRADMVLYTHAGPEISVASTKAFSTQLIALELLGLFLAERRNTMSADERRAVLQTMMHAPVAVSEALKADSAVLEAAKKFFTARDFLFLGRGTCYPIALEGALKLKEISYIHAEGYPAGEMKHGPIALIDERMPVVVILQRDKLLFDKTLSNLREVEARGAQVIVITDAPEEKTVGISTESIIRVPFVCPELSPLLLNLPLQLLAYHVAVLNKTDVDLPRNLAKSVTVE
jgi:glucosamine--fructose-6-phosphate aminotransferase (isomerizing)